MSLNFNGVSSKCQNTAATGLNAALLTLLFWMKPNSLGENSNGRIFVADKDNNALTLRCTDQGTGGSNVRFARVFSGTTGVWDTPLTTGTMMGFMLTYDNGSILNNPLMYSMVLGTDKKLVSRTVTQDTPPVGTPTTPNAGYSIGDRDDTAVCFDGLIHRMRVYNRLLTLDEGTAELWQYGTEINGRLLHINDQGTDLSGNGFNATLTNLTVADSPPEWPAWAEMNDLAYGGSAPPASHPLFRQSLLNGIGSGGPFFNNPVG
jgi:hypothetical protein